MEIDAPSLLLGCAALAFLGLVLGLRGGWLGPLGPILLLVAGLVALLEGPHAWADLRGRRAEGVIAATAEAATASR